MMISILVGTGVQLLTMTLVVLLFAMLGFVLEGLRGTLLTASIFVYVFMAGLAGYFAARLYKMFKVTHTFCKTCILNLYRETIGFAAHF